jgi:N-acetylglucosamine-6-phosphate deacetylase
MPNTYLIRGARILAEGEELSRGDILLQGGSIRKIGPRLAASGATIIPGRGLTVAPGLIDTQINGGFSRSFSGTTAAQLLEVAKGLVGMGVTAYLPTLISLPRETILRGIAPIVEAAKTKGGVAQILGIHLEGPFLAPQKRGAHRTENLRHPTPAEFLEYHAAAKGLLRKMTLAPELPGALETIAEGRRRGVIMSIGHTTATADQFARGVEAGATHVTHCFNAMPPLHHREPSALNAALVTDAVSCGFIYDRVHIHADAARLLLRSKPKGKAVLVSDAVAALGAPDGDLAADGELYVVRAGTVTVKSNGTIAGSACSILHGVKCLVQDLGMSLADAVATASAAPARLLGLKKKGVLKPGADADVILLDRNLDVRMAFVKGELLHGNPD